MCKIMSSVLYLFHLLSIGNNYIVQDKKLLSVNINH